ncbi:hypothetical protein L1987_84022 [Smallanthus sonchifolius]|uniref:Uncharacterized protein n=1 Tax=Smallanthus sonchifolius TaxID=185202 RepID=A0ACB8YE94_9ASTR|nr:hypothetical protein L1987_84022 [Smallanthus sonchifolius]
MFSLIRSLLIFGLDSAWVCFVKVISGSNCRLGEENGGVLEDETWPLSCGESNGKKKVLILMSDTGGGHRASAEAIKWAFNEKFGDDYEVGFLNLFSLNWCMSMMEIDVMCVFMCVCD